MDDLPNKIKKILTEEIETEKESIRTETLCERVKKCLTESHDDKK